MPRATSPNKSPSGTQRANVIAPADMPILQIIREIERRYGDRFSIGNHNYGGFWASKKGRGGADSALIATAKVNQWTIISNDVSVHGACLFEQVVCRRWEEIAGLLHYQPGPSQSDFL